MKEILFFITIFSIVAAICWLWVLGIDKMKKEYPDYKGDDFLNWDEKKQ